MSQKVAASSVPSQGEIVLASDVAKANEPIVAGFESAAAGGAKKAAGRAKLMGGLKKGLHGAFILAMIADIAARQRNIAGERGSQARIQEAGMRSQLEQSDPMNIFYQAMMPTAQQQMQSTHQGLMQKILGGSGGQQMMVPGETTI